MANIKITTGLVLAFDNTLLIVFKTFSISPVLLFSFADKYWANNLIAQNSSGWLSLTSSIIFWYCLRAINERKIKHCFSNLPCGVDGLVYH